MKSSLLAMNLLIFLVAGCATPYQPMGFSGGYWNERLGRNKFEIGFSGNGYTDSRSVRRYVMIRAAEVTLEYGYRYFVVVESSDESSEYTTQIRPAQGSANIRRRYDGGYSVDYSERPAQYVDVYKPGKSIIIKCFKSRPEGIEVEKAKEILEYYETEEGE